MENKRKRTDIDQAARGRIYRWVMYYYEQAKKENPPIYPTDAAFARGIGIKPATFSQFRSQLRTTAGLDVLLGLRRAFHISSDHVVDHEPPDIANPSAASPSGRPGRRTAGAGKSSA